MNKQEVVERMAEITKLSKNQSENALDAFIAIVMNQVSLGAQVKLVGFGSFKRRVMKERMGRNPQTGASIKIEERAFPKFTAGSDFKQMTKKRTN